ncbi:helix-turn-helix transcriptional regulator [Paraburkholderia sp. Tr-20389]|uniref:ArsR/SmtB family transcription factor n=1 Tax=Paraburkholderia sp. Tr-20389 TaxID=2703903 RepID=UPI00197FCF3B|nr:metalloregulator ArsR/SmtB family transcription factor [Paraburkholderia sp. Tr-20389]MBN3752767.1 helix-turn-helix transcriptional regulator [Paraburkholderia sp. Tr-20389]
MANYHAAISEVFQALSDPTRCEIVSMLGRGAQTVSVLAQPFDIALPSFMKHLAVLEHSGLIRTHKAGRARTCELVPARLSEVETWLAEQRAVWEARSDRMVEFVEHLHEEEQAHVKRTRRKR